MAMSGRTAGTQSERAARRDVWGVLAGASYGFVDATEDGTVNVAANGAATYGSDNAQTSAFLGGGSNILQIDHAFSFLADNILKVAVNITNVSGAAQTVTYRRIVEFGAGIVTALEHNDSLGVVDPNPTGMIVAASAYCYGPILGGGQYQTGNPSVPLNGLSTGGTYGTGTESQDVGAAFDVSLGSIAPNASQAFTLLYGITPLGQDVTALRIQLAGLGASFIISAQNADGNVVPGPPLAAALALIGGGPQCFRPTHSGWIDKVCWVPALPAVWVQFKEPVPIRITDPLPPRGKNVHPPHPHHQKHGPQLAKGHPKHKPAPPKPPTPKGKRTPVVHVRHPRGKVRPRPHVSIHHLHRKHTHHVIEERPYAALQLLLSGHNAR